VTKTASTHVLEPIEATTFGKRYFVIDDAKHVWGADQSYDDAVKTRERVAGNLWSKTPAVREMPADPALAKKIILMVAGPDGKSAANGKNLTPAQLDAVRTAEGGIDHVAAQIKAAKGESTAVTPEELAALEAEEEVAADLADDGDLDALLDS
jgi:hypothetical protein